jgi:hypothetical protein
MAKTDRRIRARLRKSFAPQDEIVPGLIGDGTGRTTVSGHPHLCRVRVGARRVPLVLRNVRAGHTEGQAVWIGRDRLDNRVRQVVTRRSNVAADSTGQGGASVGPHAAEHFFGRADALWASTKQIVELNVYAAGGLTVGVNSGFVPAPTGGFAQVLPVTLDLSSYLPGSLMRFVLIQATATGNVSAVAGGEFAPELFSHALIPPPDAGCYALAAVRLIAGQTAISNNVTDPDIYDLRFISGVASTIVGLQYAVRLYGDGAIKASFPGTAGGLNLALAAAEAGDTILLPLEFTASADITVPDDVTILGDGRDSTNLVGQVTCLGTARFRGVTIKAISGDATNKKGLVVSGEAATVTLIDVGVWAGTTGAGDAFGISVEAADALVQCRECYFNGYGDHHRMVNFGGQTGQSATVRQSSVDAEFITNDVAKLLTSGNTFGVDADSYGTPITTTDRAAYNHLHDSQYAPVAKGVTNGDTHDHSGGDGAQISHAGLADLDAGDNRHLSATQKTDLTDGGLTTLHKHAGLRVPLTATYLVDTVGNTWSGGGRVVGTYTFRPQDNGGLWPADASAVEIQLSARWTAENTNYRQSARETAGGDNAVQNRTLSTVTPYTTNGICNLDDDGYFYIVIEGADTASSAVRVVGYYT